MCVLYVMVFMQNRVRAGMHDFGAAPQNEHMRISRVLAIAHHSSIHIYVYVYMLRMHIQYKCTI